MLLIEAADPANPFSQPWWEIPGGGMFPGEPSAHTVARELREEAGVRTALIGPVVWTQSVQFTFAGMWFDQDEFIHVAWTDDTELDEPELEMFEAMAFRSIRWWTLEEVEAHQGRFLPPRLPELLGPLVRDELPDQPIDISPEPLR